MKIRRPWFRFWPSDWLSARSVALMTPAQKGVYIDLLSMCWVEGSIPADPDQLAFLLRLPRDEFKCIWDAVQMHFHPVKGAEKQLTNSRLEAERRNAKDRSDKNKKAAKDRWDKQHANAYANAKQTQSSTDAYSEAEAEITSEFDFEAIYRAYPGKAGKAKGLSALGKLVKSRDLYDVILAAATAYGDEEKRFKASGSREFRPAVPYFSTWVNQRRWEDGEGKQEPKRATAQLSLDERARLREARERGLLPEASQ